MQMNRRSLQLTEIELAFLLPSIGEDAKNEIQEVSLSRHIFKDPHPPSSSVKVGASMEKAFVVYRQENPTRIEAYHKYSPILDVPSRRLVHLCSLRWLIGTLLKRALILLLAFALELSTVFSAFGPVFLLVFDFFVSAHELLLMFFLSLLTGDVCFPTPHCKLLSLVLV